MRHSAVPVLFGLLVASVPLTAQGHSYKDMLIMGCPLYETVTGRFAPVYPALAQQLIEDYGITEGTCVDLGGACGPLALELAEQTDLTVYMLDDDPVCARLCGVLADEMGHRGRVRPVEGDPWSPPFRDDFADLIVSRASLNFWPDQFGGLLEAHRILRPGGVALIGGGFSRLLDPEVRDALVEWRNEADYRRPGWRQLEPDLVERLHAAGIEGARLIDEEGGVGRWIEIRK